MPGKTKCRTKYEYLELYSGPEYEIHGRYAIMANVTWMCFMLGPGIPILFPLGLVQLCSMYLIEKYALAYFFRTPINYNHHMNELQVKMLLVGPILYSAFGFWFMSTRQLLHNDVVPKVQTYDYVEQNHTIDYAMSHVNPGSPFLFLFTLSVFAIIGYTLKLDDMLFQKKGWFSN